MRRLLVIEILLVLAVSIAWSQATSGRVAGTIRDQSGAVIPNAEVLLTNTATGVRSSTKANRDGFFLFPGVTPGAYQLSVDFAGMERFTASFSIQVTQSAVIDPVLKAGATTTSVDVKDVTPLVAVDNYSARVALSLWVSW